MMLNFLGKYPLNMIINEKVFKNSLNLKIHNIDRKKSEF